MVRAIDGAAANGLYSAAARVSFTASTIGGLLALVVFPELARLRADKASFRTFLVRALALATAVGVATAVAVYFLAGPLMWVLYGPKFMGAVGMLQVLCLVIAFRGTATVALYGANAGGTQKRTVVVAIVFAALSIGADLLLLPRYGAIAAAWVSGIGQLLLAVALVAVSFMWTRSRTRGGPLIVAEGSEADGGGDALI